MGLLTDGTIAVEVQLAELLLQWPFLSDLSFVDAASSIFQPPTEIAEATGDPLHTAAAAAAAQVVQKGALQPWLYLNIIAVNSQFVLPIFDMVCFCGLLHCCRDVLCESRLPGYVLKPVRLFISRHKIAQAAANQQPVAKKAAFGLLLLQAVMLMISIVLPCMPRLHSEIL